MGNFLVRIFKRFSSSVFILICDMLGLILKILSKYFYCQRVIRIRHERGSGFFFGRIFSCAFLYVAVTVLICCSGITDLNLVWLLRHSMVPVMLKRGDFLVL